MSKHYSRYEIIQKSQTNTKCQTVIFTITLVAYCSFNVIEIKLNS